MKAEPIKIAFTSQGESVVINNKTYITWNGYASYDDRALFAIQGLESDHPEYGTSIMINEDGDRENRLGSIKLKPTKYKTRDDGSSYEVNSVSSAGIQILGLYFPVSGFLNEKDGTRRFVATYDSGSHVYLTDTSPMGGGTTSYLNHDKPIPKFIIEDNVVIEPVLDALAAFYPNFPEWYVTNFPKSGSASKFKAAAEVRKQLLNGITPAQMAAASEDIPF